MSKAVEFAIKLPGYSVTYPGLIHFCQAPNDCGIHFVGIAVSGAGTVVLFSKVTQPRQLCHHYHFLRLRVKLWHMCQNC
jgi:hypothetical protein